MGQRKKNHRDTLRALFGLNKKAEKQGEEYAKAAKEIHVEMLRTLPWLARLDEELFRRVLNGFELRQFPAGAILLKEGDIDNGMFVVVEGMVQIEIRGVTMDKVGEGSLIGEMAVLTGFARSASVVAMNSVSVLWIESTTLKSILKKYSEFENGLWEFTSKRFAMNLLGKREPYSQWEQNIFIQWLAAGVIKVPNENGWIDLENKVGVLVTGTAAMHDGSTIVKSPASLTGKEYVFSKDSRVFLRDK